MDTLLAMQENVLEVLRGLADFMLLKIGASWLLVVAAYLVGFDHFPLITALTVLVGIDLVTGTFASYKSNEPITSRKMAKTAIKWTLYMLMISASYLTDLIVPGDWHLEEVSLAFLAATELVSILENVGRAGVAIPLRLLNTLERFRDDQ